jgi:uncharacterized protein YlxW (UPF0749 family)
MVNVAVIVSTLVALIISVMCSIGAVMAFRRKCDVENDTPLDDSVDNSTLEEILQASRTLQSRVEQLKNACYSTNPITLPDEQLAQNSLRSLRKSLSAVENLILNVKNTLPTPKEDESPGPSNLVVQETASP